MSSARAFNTRITKWGELPSERKNEAILTMAEQILQEVGEDDKVTDVTASQVKTICGNVFKHFLPSGNWKGNVPNGVLKELREQIDTSSEATFVNLRNMDDYEDAANDWFGGKAEVRQPSGLKVSSTIKTSLAILLTNSTFRLRLHSENTTPSWNFLRLKFVTLRTQECV
jgi:hypothetical protein